MVVMYNIILLYAQDEKMFITLGPDNIIMCDYNFSGDER